MAYDLDRHHRRSIRLPGFDYTHPGAYFLTICTHDRKWLFGEIVNGEMRLNDAGRIVLAEWQRTAEIRPNVELDQFVIMPNHFHAILCTGTLQRAPAPAHSTPCTGTLQRAPTPEQSAPAGTGMLHSAPTAERFGKPISNSIPTIILLFKSTTTKQINQLRDTPGAAVWQRNYYEHVIRTREALGRIREYIINNPLQWAFDRENPNSVGARCNVPLQGAPSPEDEPWRI